MATPTTLLISRDGLEVGQITGAVPWDNPKAIKYIVDLKINSIKRVLSPQIRRLTKVKREQKASPNFFR